MKPGEKYIVNVHGWIMCKGIDEGKYRIELSDYKGSLTATFFKPKGRNAIARHYVSEIMIDNGNLNGNRTEVLSKLN